MHFYLYRYLCTSISIGHAIRFVHAEVLHIKLSRYLFGGRDTEASTISQSFTVKTSQALNTYCISCFQSSAKLNDMNDVFQLPPPERCCCHCSLTEPDFAVFGELFRIAALHQLIYVLLKSSRHIETSVNRCLQTYEPPCSNTRRLVFACSP